MASTPPYRHVACFVDRRHEEAIPEILALGRRLRGPGDAPLSVVHVAPTLAVLESGMTEWGLDPDEPLRPVREWLETVASAGDLSATTLAGSPPHDVAAEWVDQAGVDAIVVGAASTAVQRTLLGSFTAGLAARTTVPLVVVPPGVTVDAGAGDGQMSLGTPPLGHVACCVDDSPSAAAALDEALRLREGLGVERLTIVRAALPPRALRWWPITRVLPAPGGPVRRAGARLEARASRVPGAESALVVGHPRDVCEWAREHGADLLVAGSHGDEAGPRLPGGFARQLALHAPCPVMLVPPGG